MFSRILIANRGEIACRIIATARRMGIATVAVFSDADRDSLHVEMADSAVRIGPAEAAQSYLNGAAIIGAARESGAQAIHPGYGFLAENPDFVEAVATDRLTFIGPSAKSIRAMGLKDAAKQLMEKAGVPVVPGYHGDVQDTVVLAAKASEIGYPVLIKARAGGGGKGMRKVVGPKDFRNALASAKREAKASFGDDMVLVEKYIEKPRHIEIQIFGDSHGNILHLFERDCSLQRRHQKVIEEAPAPGMDDDMRRAMTDAAIRAAEAISYAGAGTVEFIVDASRGLRPDRFWFMEMNTRLQVEHPVTEMITGYDLVEWQLRVAAGEKLPRTQKEIAIDGHAFEARIYAEDVEKGFLPAIGTLHYLRFPEDARIDSGVRQGDTIKPYYDPMIAKLCVHGTTRAAALEKLSDRLAATRIAGSVTNVEFLHALAGHGGFARGDVDTGLIEREIGELAGPRPLPDHVRATAALAALGLDRPADSADPFSRIGSWGLWRTPKHFVDMEYRGEPFAASAMRAPRRGWLVALAQGEVEIDLISDGSGIGEIVTPDGRHQFQLARWPGHVTVFVPSEAHDFVIVDAYKAAEEEAATGNSIVAPMSGLVKVMQVAAGEKVAKGEPVLVLEAMKMEHPLTAPRDGVIAELRTAEGQQVTEGAVLLTFDPEPLP